jgi:hypothetical protein
VPKRDEVTGDWRKLHIHELNNVYTSPNTLRVIKSRRMRWEGYVARIGEYEAYRGYGGETGWKETAWETQAWMVE